MYTCESLSIKAFPSYCIKVIYLRCTCPWVCLCDWVCDITFVRLFKSWTLSLCHCCNQLIIFFFLKKKVSEMLHFLVIFPSFSNLGLIRVKSLSKSDFLGVCNTVCGLITILHLKSSIFFLWHSSSFKTWLLCKAWRLFYQKSFQHLHHKRQV